MKARIGIIGGTGVYDPEMFELKETVRPLTPYGPASDEIQIGEMKGVPVAFLPRHGRGHVIPPHMINYRANIYAMKKLGVERIISPCAVGSLQEEYKPGEIAIIDQFIDLTKSRKYTFFDGPRTVHIGAADPFCPEVSSLFAKEAKKAKIPFHDAVEMCYISLAMITDYDVWADHPVDTATILRTMAENMDKIRALISRTVPKIPVERKKCDCGQVLAAAGA